MPCSSLIGWPRGDYFLHPMTYPYVPELLVTPVLRTLYNVIMREPKKCNNTPLPCFPFTIHILPSTATSTPCQLNVLAGFVAYLAPMLSSNLHTGGHLTRCSAVLVPVDTAIRDLCPAVVNLTHPLSAIRSSTTCIGLPAAKLYYNITGLWD